MSTISTRSFKKIASATLAAATLATTMIASTGSAEARYYRHGYLFGGVAAGLALGALATGAMASSNGAAYVEDGYAARRVCRLEARYSDEGDYLGRVRTCRLVAE